MSYKLIKDNKDLIDINQVPLERLNNIETRLSNLENSLGPIKYCTSLTANHTTGAVSYSMPWVGVYLVVANYAHWASAGGVWFVLNNPGDKRAVNIVSSSHASIAVNGNNIEFSADSWGSECHIYYL